MVTGLPLLLVLALTGAWQSSTKPQKIKFISAVSPGYENAIYTSSSDEIGGRWVTAVLKAHGIEAGGDSSAGVRAYDVPKKRMQRAKHILLLAARQDGFVVTRGPNAVDILESAEGGWKHVTIHQPLQTPVKAVPKELRMLPKTWTKYFDMPFIKPCQLRSVDYRRRYVTLSGRRRLLGYEVRFHGELNLGGMVDVDFQVDKGGIL